MPSERSSKARMAPMLDTPQTCQPLSSALQISAWETAGCVWIVPSQSTSTPGASARSSRRSTSPRRTGGCRSVPPLRSSSLGMSRAEGPAKSVTLGMLEHPGHQPRADADLTAVDDLAARNDHPDDVDLAEVVHAATFHLHA